MNKEYKKDNKIVKTTFLIMTKHLRLMIVAMLTIACSLVGKAADGATYKLVTDASELKSGDVVVIASGTNAMGAVNIDKTKIDPVKVTITDGILKYAEGLGETILESNGNNWYLKFNGQYISYESRFNENVNTQASTDKYCLFSISIDQDGNATIKNNERPRKKNLSFSNGSSFGYYNNDGTVQIYKKQRRANGIAFAATSANDDFNGNSNEAKQYVQLINPNNLPVTYTSSNSYVAGVDENGNVTLNSWGTTTITATFAGNDDYTQGAVSYELNVNNIVENIDFKVIEFVAGKDKGHTSILNGSSQSDEMAKYGVKIHSGLASFATDEYHINGNSSSTDITVESGKIIRIEMVGSDMNRLQGTSEGNYKIESDKIIWTGNSQKVSFKNDQVVWNYAAPTSIKIYVDYPIVDLAEESANDLKTLDNTYVKLNRTLVADKWNTLCVPFAISEEEIKANFGEGTLVEKLDAVNGNTVNFADATSIEAGVPYLIKPTVAGTTYTFNGKDVIAEAPKTEGNADVTFQGIYSPTDITNGGTVKAAGVTEDGKVLFVNADSQTKAFRCFFTISDNATISPTMLKISIKGVETAINSIVMGNSNAADNAIYNLQGQRVNGNSLTKGIYIKNGKKFAVK